MKIAILQFAHLLTSKNGAEMYHHNLAKWMQLQGWQVNVYSHTVAEPLLYDGVQAEPFVRFKPDKYDLIVTTPGISKSNRSNYPMICIQHNEIREVWDMRQRHVIYCAHHVKDTVNYGCIASMVFYPFNRYAGQPLMLGNPGGKITLVNTNANKGGHVLVNLAKRHPEWQFLGITQGYGHQIQGEAPNLEYRPGGDDLREVLKDTSVLIMPSEREGMPTLALEAMSLGVPIAPANIPAFRELGIARSGKFDEVIEYTLADYYRIREQNVERINKIESERNYQELRTFVEYIFHTADRI